MFGLPDPYLKISLRCGRGESKLAHHSQQLVSSVQYDTINPSWEGEVSARVMCCHGNGCHGDGCVWRV